MGMLFERRSDAAGPLRPEPITRLEEDRRLGRAWRLGTGTLACPRCDAPVVPDGPASPATLLECPYCEHTGALREFLTLGEPARPTRVAIRVVPRAGHAVIP